MQFFVERSKYDAKRSLPQHFQDGVVAQAADGPRIVAGAEDLANARLNSVVSLGSNFRDKGWFQARRR